MILLQNKLYIQSSGTQLYNYDCVKSYRIYSIKRRGVYLKIFRDSSALFIQGRRLFKIQFISCKQ